MANENAKRDNNNSFSILGVDATTGDTRRIKVGPNGGILIEAVQEASVYRTIDLDESEEEVSATPVYLTGYFITNRGAAERTIRFYDGLAVNVIVGTTTPKLSITLAAGQSANLSNLNLPFDTAMCAAATTGILDTDTGAPGTNDVIANIFTRPQ